MKKSLSSPLIQQKYIASKGVRTGTITMGLSILVDVEDGKSTEEEAIGGNGTAPGVRLHAALQGREIRQLNAWRSEFLEELGRIRLSCGCKLIHQNSEQTLETVTVTEKRF